MMDFQGKVGGGVIMSTEYTKTTSKIGIIKMKNL